MPLPVLGLLLLPIVAVGCASARHDVNRMPPPRRWMASEGWLLAVAAWYPDQDELDRACAARPPAEELWIVRTEALCNRWRGPKQLHEVGDMLRRVGATDITVADMTDANQYTFDAFPDFRVFDVQVEGMPCVRLLGDQRLSESDVTSWLTGHGSGEAGAMYIYAMRPAAFPSFVGEAIERYQQESDDAADETAAKTRQ
jgi:hypothetical protein